MPNAPRQDSPELSPLRPMLSLLVNTRGGPPTEIVLETPISPLSPVIFSSDDAPTEIVETVAKRLSTLGFIEVCAPRDSSESRTTLTLLEEHTPRSSADGRRDSSDSSGSERPEEVEIRVELVSAASENRWSRAWTFEKKGKRWIERDYDEILRQLRKL